MRIQELQTKATRREKSTANSSLKTPITKEKMRETLSSSIRSLIPRMTRTALSTDKKKAWRWNKRMIWLETNVKMR